MEMRVLFLGMNGRFSKIVLEQLLTAGVQVSALLIPGQGFRPVSAQATPADPLELPLFNPHLSESAVELAWRAKIPVFESGAFTNPNVRNWLAGQKHHVACVACWNRIIPADVLTIPRFGFLNVHPSLLPAYRGPEPLFWQFQAGETHTGVTVHWMDSGLDTGDIAEQQPVPFPDGISGPEADAACAVTGGMMLADVLARLTAGTGRRQTQPAGGSYFPAPNESDFRLDPGWTVRRVFNFMRGTGHWGFPYRLDRDGHTLWLQEALDWREGFGPAMGEPLAGSVAVRFADGVLWAREATLSSIS